MEKERDTEVVKLRMKKDTMKMVRALAKKYKRTLSVQFEDMILAGAPIIEAKQPFVLAVFPKGADEEEIDTILGAVGKMQIGSAPEQDGPDQATIS